MAGLIIAWSAGWLTVAALAPANPEADALAKRGWELWQQQEFSSAIEPFEQAVKLDPKNVNAWNGLGWARFNGGDAEKAIEAFNKCIKLEPKHPAALNGLGQIYLMWREYGDAEKYLKKAAPQAPAAWFGLARLYMLTGDYKEAQKWIRKSISQQPEDETLKQLLANAKEGRLDDTLRKQIEGPGRPEKTAGKIPVGTAWMLLNQGKTREAEQEFRKILKQEPENFGARNGLGFALLNLGEPEAAKEQFEECLKIEPEAPGSMNGLARCLYALDQVDEALATWEKMYELQPGPNAAAVGLAQTYLEREEYAKAIPFFEVLVKAQPQELQYKAGLKAAKEGASAAATKK